MSIENDIEFAQAVKTMSLSGLVRHADRIARESSPMPEEQLSALMVAVALAFGRCVEKYKMEKDGPRKKKMLAGAMKDFEAKVRKYGWTPRVNRNDNNSVIADPNNAAQKIPEVQQNESTPIQEVSAKSESEK